MTERVWIGLTNIERAWRAGELGYPAIADTHPKDGDVEQAPLVSGGGAQSAIAQPQASHKYSMKEELNG